MKKLLASITVAASLISFHASAMHQPTQSTANVPSHLRISRTTSLENLETLSSTSELPRCASNPVPLQISDSLEAIHKVDETLEQVGDTAETAKKVTQDVTHLVRNATEAMLEHVSDIEDEAGLQKSCSSCLGTSIGIIDKIEYQLSRFFSFLSTIGRGSSSKIDNA